MHTEDRLDLIYELHGYHLELEENWTQRQQILNHSPVRGDSLKSLPKQEPSKTEDGKPLLSKRKK